MNSIRLINKYLNLLEASLVGTLNKDPPSDPWAGPNYNPLLRSVGRDWPGLAQTMIGTARMRNLRVACETAILDCVAGDFIETGVWRGGACIFMKGILEAYGERERRVFVADSFIGLPEPDAEKYVADKGDTHHTHKQLAVSRQDVEENFKNYRLLDERVVFLEGWFKDTLHLAPIEKLAVLRIDGDMYESTIQAMEALYSKLSPGGFLIVDDYFLAPCAQAINEFRAKHRITEVILPIDGMGIYWRRNG